MDPARFLPDAATAAVVLPLSCVYVLAAAAFAGWLRTRRHIATPYTRKTFHFLTISMTMVVQVIWGLGGVVVFAAVITAAVLYAVLRGDGFAFYEALARPGDAPHRRLFILVPLVTTAAGGILTNLLFPAWAHVGYMVVAWGDAVGEPVGTRWGRHRYQVPSLAGVPATRSLEGSAAVAVAAAAAAAIAIAVTGVPLSRAIAAGVGIGIAAAAAEAVSHHGLDNFTLQVVGAGVAWGVMWGWG